MSTMRVLVWLDLKFSFSFKKKGAPKKDQAQVWQFWTGETNISRDHDESDNLISKKFSMDVSKFYCSSPTSILGPTFIFCQIFRGISFIPRSLEDIF